MIFKSKHHHFRLLINLLLTVLLVNFLAIFISTNAYAQPVPDWKWAYSAGTTGNDYGKDICMDESGNVYVTGTFKTSATFGETTLNSAGDEDIFIVKYNSAGIVQWAKSFGDIGLDVSRSLSVDAAGNLYLTGFFRSENITFGNFSLYNQNSAFGYDQFYLVKCDSSGTVMWAVESDGLGNMDGRSVATDKSGNIMVTGYFDGNDITFGSFSLPNAGVLSSDIFIVKYNTDGTPVWAKTVGGNGYEVTSGIATDNDGNIYITGYYESSTLSIGSTSLANMGERDMLVAKFDADGNPVWANSANGSCDDTGADITIDANGNVWVTGSSCSETLSIGTMVFNGNDYDKVIGAKYDAAGNLIWANIYSSEDNAEGYSITADQKGNVFIAGAFTGNMINFGNFDLVNVNAEYDDIFVTKLDNDGSVVWSISAGGTDDDEATAIVSDYDGNTYVTGDFYSRTLNLGITALANTDNSENSTDLFVSKIVTSVGINEQHSAESPTVYPNPASGFINILCDKGSVIQVINMDGKLVKKVKSKQATYKLDISGLLPGMYVVKTIKQGGETAITSFIKK